MSRLPWKGPPWENENAVFEMVKWWLVGLPDPGSDEIVPVSEWIDEAVRDAIEAARQGNYRPLADLHRGDPPFDKLESPVQFSAEARRLVADGLEDKNPRVGHRPPMTEQEKRAKCSTHDAVDNAFFLWTLFDLYYPDQGEKEKRERACHFAARIVGGDGLVGDDLKEKVRKRVEGLKKERRDKKWIFSK
jgi:hypothetical protein